MKLIHLLCLGALCCTPVLRADDCCESKTVVIAQHLRDIELKITFNVFEQILTEKAKAEVQLTLLEADRAGGELNSETYDKNHEGLERKIAVLAHRAKQIRDQIDKLGSVTLAEK